MAVGSGSYASALPASTGITTDSNPVYVLPGNTAPLPTNDWWTPLLTQNMYGGTKYHLWAHPLDLTVESYGLGLHYATAWSGGNNTNQQMVAPDPVRIGGAGFAPNSEKVKSWGDWTVAFRLAESATEYADVTIGHGLPLTWVEYAGVAAGQVGTDASASYFAAGGAAQAFPFTGSSYGFNWQGRSYAVFAPDGTAFSLSNGTVTATFAGTTRFLVVAAMPSQASFATFAQHAYAVPRNSTVSWAYDEEAGTLATTWHVQAEALQGSSTDVLQGFLPHHLKYTTLGFSPLAGSGYLTARGTMQLAAGNDFKITYPYYGTLNHLPAPEVLPGKANGYDFSQENGYLSSFAGSQVLLGDADTYGSGKSLTLFARFLADSYVLGNGNLPTYQGKLRTALANWLTYTPGEANTYYARLPNFGALLGLNTGYGSEQFNDHHFHYGYHVYAAAVLGLHDATFLTQYGEMAKLVAKEYANWDRTDTRFPLFRTFDAWEGHSWANGGYGMNPPIGNNQESSSEAMMSWAGLLELGVATGDNAMRDAGVFGYVSEAAGSQEYWFDRDDENLAPGYGPPGKLVGIVGGCNTEYQTFFGLSPWFIHGIQYLPVLPSSYYLVQHDKFAAAQTEFNYLLSRAGSEPGAWGAEWDNAALAYVSLFNPEYAAAHQAALGTDAGLAGPTYYTLHSNRALGHRRFDYHIGAANSGVFYNDDLKQFTYCAYNPTDAAHTYHVYQGGNDLGTLTIKAHSFFSTHQLGSTSNDAPTVALTAPAAGATYTAPATVVLTAAATDDDGTVAKVDFYDGTTLLGSATAAPFTYTWTGAPAGLHSLSAIATDNGGATGTSLAVPITINSGVCTGTGPGGEYSYEVSTTGGITTWRFLPLGSTVGSTLALLYTRAGSGGYGGYNMAAQPDGSFVYSQTWPAGTAVQFYFTYRVGSTGTEHNSSAAPASYVTGTVCTTALAVRGSSAATFQLYPNPARHLLTVETAGNPGGELLIRNVLGAVLLRQPLTGNTTAVDVSGLAKGLYLLTVGAESRRFVRE